MTDPLPCGAICFLIRLAEAQDWVGRSVEVLSGPVFVDDDTDYYRVTAGWLTKLYGGDRVILAHRTNLLLISPPELEVPTMRAPAHESR